MIIDFGKLILLLSSFSCLSFSMDDEQGKQKLYQHIITFSHKSSEKLKPIKLYACDGPQRIMALLGQPYTPPSQEDLDLARKDYKNWLKKEGMPDKELSEREAIEFYNVNWLKVMFETLENENPDVFDKLIEDLKKQ